jgi:NAD(P)-dependent dehydrogenase (short-subunit alcohol dehydrogenase family)
MNQWKLAFITGGGSGIGRRLAQLLLADGTSVVVFDRSNSREAQEVLQEAAAGSEDVACQFFQTDVSDAAAVESAVQAAVDAMGVPDIVINCAGIQNAKMLLQQSADEFEQLVRINLIGSRNVAAAVLPHMKRGGQLALVASLAGIVPSYSYSAYNASKFGVVGLAGALRLECVEHGIDVSVICPPEIDTPMVVEERKSLPAAGAKLKETAGTLKVEPACDYMYAGLKRRKYMIVPGFRARRVSAIARWFPNLMRRVSEAIVLSTVRSG